MDKSNLEQIALQLASAEFFCKGLSKIALETQNKSENNIVLAKLEAACARVKELTLEANRIRSALPELASKSYWWDVPFTAEEPSFDNVFSFDNGIYIEGDKICSVLNGIKWYMQPQKEYIDYSQFSSRLTGDNAILFYLNKKELLNNINSRFEKRYIYNVMSVTRYFETISYMNPYVSPISLVLNDYKQQQEMLLQEREKSLDEAQREHDRRWDIYEMISHNSLMTNEERWLYGKMKDEQYFNERIIRDYYGGDKARKIKKEYERDLADIRNRSQQAQRLAQKRYVKSETSVTGEANIIRVMPVGEVLYCNDRIITIFCYKSPQQITEFDCDKNIVLNELCGEYYTKKELFAKAPDAAPVARHIAMHYSDILPKYNVLSPRPKGCSDELWRVWTEIRFLTDSDYNYSYSE